MKKVAWTTARMELNTICCEKQMKNFSGYLNDDTQRFICLDCGNTIDIIYPRLDDEELLSFLENFEDDEIKNSKIFKELKEFCGCGKPLITDEEKRMGVCGECR